MQGTPDYLHHVSKLTKIASADFTDLFKAVDLEELVAIMANLENGVQGWLLIHPKGGRRPTLLVGREQMALDLANAEKVAAIKFPDTDETCDKSEPWAVGLLRILGGEHPLVRKTELLVPIISDGCLLAVAGIAGSFRKATLAVNNINHAVRQLHEMDCLRQDLAGHKFLRLHSAIPMVLITASGRMMDGTHGGLAVLGELKPKDAQAGASPAIPLALRRGIEKGDQEIVLGGYKARISCPPLFRVMTTAEPLIRVAFFRTVHQKAVEHARENLTPAQQRVHNYLMAGDRNKEIADKLQISEHTVRHHVSAVLRKFSCSDRLLLVARAAVAPHAEL